MYVLADSAITQTEHGQIYTIIQQLLKLHLLDVVTMSVNAFEIIDCACTTDDVTPASFTSYAHFQVLLALIFKQCDVLPA